MKERKVIKNPLWALNLTQRRFEALLLLTSYFSWMKCITWVGSQDLYWFCFKFPVCFFPLLAGRFSDFHLTQNRKKTLLWPKAAKTNTHDAVEKNGPIGKFLEVVPVLIYTFCKGYVVLIKHLISCIWKSNLLTRKCEIYQFICSESML